MTSGSLVPVGLVARNSASACAAAVRVRLQLPAPSWRSGSPAHAEPFDFRWLMAAVKTSPVLTSRNVWMIGGRFSVSMNAGLSADVMIRVVPIGVTLAGLYRNATLMASVPIVSVSTNVYVPGAVAAFSPSTICWLASPLSFSISVSPTTSASMPFSEATILASWATRSASLSAPRQSSVPDGPHGPAVVLAVVSIVAK